MQSKLLIGDLVEVNAEPRDHNGADVAIGDKGIIIRVDFAPDRYGFETVYEVDFGDEIGVWFFADSRHLLDLVT